MFKFRYLCGAVGLGAALYSHAYRTAIASTLEVKEAWTPLIAFVVAYLAPALIGAAGGSDREVTENYYSENWWDFRKELGLSDSIRVEYLVGALLAFCFQFYLVWKTFRGLPS